MVLRVLRLIQWIFMWRRKRDYHRSFLLQINHFSQDQNVWNRQTFAFDTVFDFGNLKSIKFWLRYSKTLVFSTFYFFFHFLWDKVKNHSEENVYHVIHHITSHAKKPFHHCVSQLIFFSTFSSFTYTKWKYV